MLAYCSSSSLGPKQWCICHPEAIVVQNLSPVSQVSAAHQLYELVHEKCVNEQVVCRFSREQSHA